ncbi:MAG: NAD(P)/FAD-dependent oxidoreductase [Gomphosphaeria aponina SAG 52.96 = DSM 107014]|uniref:NAD(P)/FAD-dependent oxidoreductase n=1 Tax=Gomphosphaeria aponina SAG 52.96 = DSM 107014 TaxID=1521640 RepID=A0A941GWE8_9CHRO|nr:NAD(P)/FAD-dependent oxidoreductase [Gomphosphaeria aponina SAG 52.96 = DSM 107014]
MKLSKKNLQERSNQIYDVVIVGGGAGGLSAGIYLQRYRLSSLIVDKGKARSFWMQELHNYLGLPPDTPGKVLLQQGQKHYLSLDGDFLNGYVETVEDFGEAFAVKVKIGRQNSIYQVFRSKYLIVASGIIDNLPPLEDMENVFEYAGYNLHVCMVCDGYEMVDKQCGLFAGSETSITEMIFNLSWFTPYITVFTHGLFEVSQETKNQLREHGYRLVETPIKSFSGQNHQMTGVELIDGSTIQLETGLISMGSKYHNAYLQGINLDYQGNNLITDKMGRTSHPKIFAIGDLKVGLNQVVVAAGDGALAATQIWRDIRRATEPRRWTENLTVAV